MFADCLRGSKIVKFNAIGKFPIRKGEYIAKYKNGNIGSLYKSQ